MRLPLASLACAVASFVAGYSIFRAAESWMRTGARSSSDISQNGSITRTDSSDPSPKLDVESFLDLCKKPGGLKHEHDIFAALQKMQPADFLAAVADMPNLASRFEELPPLLRHPIVAAAIERWLDIDPEGALRWFGISSLTASAEKSTQRLQWLVVHGNFPIFAQRHPEWCRQQIDLLPAGDSRDSAVKELAAQLARSDRQKALLLLESLPTDADKRAAKIGIVGGLAAADPEAAMDFALTLSKEEGQQESIQSLVWNGGSAGAGAAGRILNRIRDPKERQSALWILSASLARDSASDALNFIEQQWDPNTKLAFPGDGDGFSPVGWLAEVDPLKAVQWFDAHLEGNSRSAALNEALEVWQNTDPAAALRWMSTQPVEKLPTSARRWESTLTTLAASAPQEFERWVDSLPDGNARESARTALSSRYAQLGKVSDAIRVFSASNSAQSSENAARSFAQSIAAKDLTSTMAWFSQLQPGPAQVGAARGIASSWTQCDPQAAASWIERLPPGSSRDGATHVLADIVAYADPTTAAQWVERIADPKVRTVAAQNVYNLWACENPVQAREWVLGLDQIDDRERSKFLRAWGQ